MSKIVFLYIFVALTLFKFNRCHNDPEESYPGEVLDEEDPTPATADTGRDEEVIVLTEDNFDSMISENEVILVEFYAPWCGHCKNLAPHYAQAAKILKKHKPPVALAKVDCIVEKTLASRFDIQGYPILYFFKNGQQYQYDGPRTSEGIVEYMRERADPGWEPPPSAVSALTQNTILDFLTSHKLSLVMFYSPSCPHCQHLMPVFEKAAQNLKKEDIALGKVDGMEEGKLATKYNVTAWPTLIVFHKGKPYNYRGPRDHDGIVSYMLEQSKPPTREISSLKPIHNAIKYQTAIYGHFNNNHSPFYKEYVEAANERRNKFAFFHQFGSGDAERISLFQCERFFSKYESQAYHLSQEDGAKNKDDILKFWDNNSLPLVGQRTRGTMWLYRNHFPLVVVYYTVDFSYSHRADTQLIRNKVVEVAKKYRKQITFAIADEEEFAEELRDLNLDDSGEDINAAFFRSPRERYRMEPTDDDLVKSLQKFVEDIQAGKLSQHFKSQLTPKENNGTVKVVVGKTFEKMIYGSKDTLLEFYAPWCGPCKTLEPVYAKVAKHFANNPDIQVAKIDGDSNDFPPEFNIRGFPQIFFVPARWKSKPIVEYSGERTFEKLTQFVSEQLGEKQEL